MQRLFWRRSAGSRPSVRDERAALASLRTSLGEMAQAIARAKAVADSENAAAMLDEFEHRVDAMIEIAGGAPAAEQAAEPDQVPTVSDVVLRLGPADTAPEPAVADAAPPADTGGGKGPTVAMLTAMVQALSASIQTPTPEAEADALPKPEAAAPPPSALATLAEFTPWPVEAEAPATPEPAAEWEQAEPEPVAEATPASVPGETLAQESTLLASFEQMEIRPFPPPEEGTAVIFTSSIFTSKIEPANPQAEHGFAPPAPPEPAATPDPAPAAPAEAAAPEVVAIEPEAAAPPPEGSVASKSVEADFDPTDFLFGPEPEPDPAAFLLDPAPPPQTQKAVLPQPEFVSVATPAEPPATEELEPAAAEGRSTAGGDDRSRAAGAEPAATRSAACAQGDEPERKARAVQLERQRSVIPGRAHQRAYTHVFDALGVRARLLRD